MVDFAPTQIVIVAIRTEKRNASIYPEDTAG